MSKKTKLLPTGGTLSGPHVLLVWWTNSEQHQLIVAHNEKQAEQIWKYNLEEHNDAELKSYWNGNIVGPSTVVRKAWEQKLAEDEIEHFVRCVCGYLNIGEYSEPPEPLPRGVVKCTQYEPRWPEAGFSSHESHYDCANCFEGASVGIRVEEFFRRKQHLFNLEKKIVRTDLPEPDPNEPLLIVALDAGHHRNGISIEIVTEAPTTDQVLFFFQGKKCAMPSWATQPLSQRTAEDAAKKAARAQQWDERQAAQKKESQAFLAKLLEGVV